MVVIRDTWGWAGAYILGAAIGDAMGHPTEFISSFDEIRSRFGPNGVTGFELYWERDGSRFAPYTDDFQMAEAVLRGLIEGKERGADLDETMSLIAERFVQWAAHPQGGHRAPGNACLRGCRALAAGVPWREAGGATAGGCGSVMRAWPFGLFFAGDLKKGELWAVEHSKMTHGDPIALAACAAITVGIGLNLQGQAEEHVAREMVAAAERYDSATARMIKWAVDDAKKGVGPEITLDRLRGWAAHEAIAAATYVFLHHADDPRKALLEAANTPGDSDSIATLVGALVGARCGLDGLPEEWLKEVERTDELVALMDLQRTAQRRKA